jgi:hypothetical protein
MTAKKSTKKTAVSSKKPAKKPAKRIVKKRITRTIPDEQHFVLVTGKRLQHYMALADVLEELEDTVVRHHVNEVRHDFANWVRHVFSEEALADELANAHDKKEMRLIIYKHLVKKHLM